MAAIKNIVVKSAQQATEKIGSEAVEKISKEAAEKISKEATEKVSKNVVPKNPNGVGPRIKDAVEVSDDSIKETIEQVRKSNGTFEPMPKIPSIMESPTSGNPIFSPVTQGATQMPKISQLEPVAKAPTPVPESKGASTPKRGPTKENLWQKERAEKKAALKKDEQTAKWNKGIQTAVGVGVSGAVVFNMFGSKGQQSNSQLYSNQGY